MDSENDKYKKRRKVVTIVSFAVMAAFFTITTAMLWRPLINTFRKPVKFREWVNNHGIAGRLAFIGMAALQVIFAVIPGEPMELGAGYAFKAIEGTILCLIGNAIGSSIVFLFTKLFGIKMVEAFISKEKINSFKFMRREDKLNLLTFIIFLIPGTPKDVITYLIGLTPMKLKVFLIITSIARIPSIATSTITGSALGVRNYRFAAVVYAVTGIISLIGIVLYKKISKHYQKDEQKDKKKKPANDND